MKRKQLINVESIKILYFLYLDPFVYLYTIFDEIFFNNNFIKYFLN